MNNWVIILALVGVVVFSAICVTLIVLYTTGKKSNSSSKYKLPIIPSKLQHTFNRKIKVIQRGSVTFENTGVYVIYGIAGSNIENPDVEDLKFVEVTNPLYMYGSLHPTVFSTENANISFTIPPQNKETIKYLVVGVKDSTTDCGLYSSWKIVKVIENLGLTERFTEGLEAFVPLDAYTGQDPSAYTLPLAASLRSYISDTYRNLDASTLANIQVYEAGPALNPV